MPNYATNLKWRFDKKSAQLVVDNTLKQKLKEALKSTDPITGKLLMEDLVNLPGPESLRVKNLFYDLRNGVWTFNAQKVNDFFDLNFSNIFEY